METDLFVDLGNQETNFKDDKEMNSDLQTFTSNVFGELRTAYVGSCPFVCLLDVCRVLTIGNPSDVKSRLAGDGVVTIEVIDRLGRKQFATFINESNLYKVIFQSRKPEAEKFTEWVTSEVLPSIRKTGMYAIDDLLDDPDLAIKAFTQLKLERQARKEAENRLAEATPKAEYYDALVDKKASTSFRTTAKELHIKERVFIAALLEDKFIFRDSKKQLCPYAEFVSSGIFEVKDWQAADKVGVQTLITVKGKDLFLKKYKNLQSIEVDD